MKVKQPRYAADRESGELMFDGVLPYLEVIEAFRRSASGLPDGLSALVAEKIRQYARPNSKYRRKGSVTPPWIERLRKRAL
jgi:hypothetical protein